MRDINSARERRVAGDRTLAKCGAAIGRKVRWGWRNVSLKGHGRRSALFPQNKRGAARRPMRAEALVGSARLGHARARPARRGRRYLRAAPRETRSRRADIISPAARAGGRAAASPAPDGCRDPAVAVAAAPPARRRPRVPDLPGPPGRSHRHALRTFFLCRLYCRVRSTPAPRPGRPMPRLPNRTGRRRALPQRRSRPALRARPS